MNRRELMRAVGLNIATRRTRMRLSQDELAGLSGCHRVSISYYESGRRLPDVEKLMALAGVFGCPMADLLAGVPGVTEVSAG